MCKHIWRIVRRTRACSECSTIHSMQRNISRVIYAVEKFRGTRDAVARGGRIEGWIYDGIRITSSWLGTRITGRQ